MLVLLEDDLSLVCLYVMICKIIYFMFKNEIYYVRSFAFVNGNHITTPHIKIPDVTWAIFKNKLNF